MGAQHLIEGEFQSEYPSLPRGLVPLDVNNATAQDLLWEYAQRRRAVDAEFSDELENVLLIAGYKPPSKTEAIAAQVAADASKAALDAAGAVARGGRNLFNRVRDRLNQGPGGNGPAPT